MEKLNFGMILINDLQGYKSKSAFKKFLSGGLPYSVVNVLQGELLLELKERGGHFNYQLYRDASVQLFCTQDDVAPLSYVEFVMLEPTRKPVDILNTYNNKLEWGKQLKVGSHVNVTLGGPVPAVEPVRSMVHYIGPIGNHPGVYFGVELLATKYRTGKFGTTDGSFQDTRYFTCEDGCGLFVPLRLLSPLNSASKHTDDTKPKVSNEASSKNDEKRPLSKVSSKSVMESCVDSLYSKGQRVSFYDNHGGKHYGTVEWNERSSASKYAVVGIKTDDAIYSITDYDESVPGLNYKMASVPNNHALFLPETLLDEVPSQTQSAATSSKGEVKETFDSEQKRIAHENAADLLALVVSEESLDIKKQQETIKRYHAERGSWAGHTGIDHGACAAHLSSVDSPKRSKAGGCGDSSSASNQPCFHEFDRVYDQIPTSRQLSLPYQSDRHIPEDYSSLWCEINQHRKPSPLHPMQDNDIFNSEQARITSEDAAALQALAASEECLDIKRQQEAYKRYQAESESRGSGTDLTGLDHRAHAAHLGQVSNVDSPKRSRAGNHGDSIGGNNQPHPHKVDHAIISLQQSQPHQLDRHIAGKGISASVVTPSIAEKNTKKRYEEEIEKLRADIHVAKIKEEYYQSSITQHIQEAEASKKALCEKMQRIEHLEEELKVEASKSANLQAQMEVMQISIEKKDNLIQAKIQQLDAKDATLFDKETSIARMRQEIIELQQELETEKNADLKEMQSSALWNISRTEIRNLPKVEIGSGAWGIVYSAKFRGQNVAIKQAHRQLLHKSTMDMVKREIVIMAHIQHPNLVRFIAAVLDSAVEKRTDTPIIIFELMDMNLRDAYARVNLTSQHISIFCDVAYALHYLHQHRPSIIHRDVSAPNVLLKALPHGGYRAKVSDFGSANLAKQSKTAGAGAIVYCAPEMFPSEDITKPPQPQTTKVDVFSYGILLLEVVVREMPTPESRYTLLQKVKTQWSVAYELIIHCTKPSPSERPTMADILNRLNRVSP